MEVASAKASADPSVEAVFMEGFMEVSTKAFVSVSTAACMKASIEVSSKEAWTEAFYGVSYFHGQAIVISFYWMGASTNKLR